MKPKDYISREEQAASAERHGFKMLPPDHPIYSEGPSITFSSRTPRPSAAKDIGSQPTASPKGSGTPKPSGK